MLNRRNFLAAAAAALAFPYELLAQIDSAPRFPGNALLQTDADAFWKEIRQQFPLPPEVVYLNNGTCGVSPYPVLKAVFDSFLRQERMEDVDAEKYPLFGYGTFDEFREPLARFIGCDKQEVAIVRNATEANAIMANGLDFNPGDEVLMSDQEHPSGEGPWSLRAKRQGIVIKRFKLPLPPKSPSEVLQAISDSITPKTRVLFVSHITTVTGVVLPVKEISALARAKGIVSMIDGAQVCGMMEVNVRDIGCDMYSSSPHKWLMAPKGTGFLYLRDEIIDRVWSHTTTEGWDNPKLRAARFQQYGSANLPLVVGMIESIRMAQSIGLKAIERRNRELADYLLKGLSERGAESWTSPDPAMRCAIVTVNVPPVVRVDLENWLWRERRIRIRGGATPHKIRLSTPYYLQKADIDRFLEAFSEFKRAKGIA
jgi:selenocysteine lyase/cysteine desulfurase